MKMYRLFKRVSILFVIVYAFFTVTLKAQSVTCNCQQNIDSLHFLVEKNYAGFSDKVNATTSKSFYKKLHEIKATAKNTRSEKLCFKLLEEYCKLYYDKHLYVTSSKEINTYKKLPKPFISSLSVDKIDTYFNTKKPENIEGIWKDENNTVAIIENKAAKRYEAIVLKSSKPHFKKGSLKFTFSHQYFNYYASKYYTTALEEIPTSITHFKNYLYIDQYAIYKKVSPKLLDTITYNDFEKYLSSVYFERINNTTCYLKVVSLQPHIKPILDSTLQANKWIIENTPNLMIDFSTNYGGSTLTFNNLLQLFYTKQYIALGSKHFLTPIHVSLMENFLNTNRSNFNATDIQKLENFINDGKKNPYSWREQEKDTFAFSNVLKNPTRVAILSSANNASSGEEFLIIAKNISDKVTIFGKNSAGLLDYGDIAGAISLPYKAFNVFIPSRRANYLDKGISYDKTGYLPDVDIPTNNSNWIQFVLQYWQNNKLISN